MIINLNSKIQKIWNLTKSVIISLFEWLSHTFISGGSLFAGFCKKYKIILCSFAGAVVVSTACWVRDNIPTTYFDSLDALSYSKYFHSHKELKYDSVCFLDISNYHQTSKVEIDKSFSDGDLVITRRNKLIQFLDTIKTVKYKFLFIDLFFDSLTYNDNTEIFEKISDLDNILVCSTPEGVEEDPRFLALSAPNSYYVPHFAAGHTRPYFIRDGYKQSVPVRMYNALHSNDSIMIPDGKCWYDFKFLGDSVRIPLKRFYRNSPITFIPYIDDMNKPNWGFWDIYEDIDDYFSELEGKIVIVGDMYRDDLHSTYVGSIPGPVLTYLQYVSLQKRSYYEICNCLLFIVFFVFIWIRLTFFRKSQKQKKELYSAMMTGQFHMHSVRYPSSKNLFDGLKAVLLAFATSFIGYSVIFGFISWVMIFGKFAFSTFVPSLLFSILEWLLDSKNKYNDLTIKRLIKK